MTPGLVAIVAVLVALVATVAESWLAEVDFVRKKNQLALTAVPPGPPEE